MSLACHDVKHFSSNSTLPYINVQNSWCTLKNSTSALSCVLFIPFYHFVSKDFSCVSVVVYVKWTNANFPNVSAGIIFFYNMDLK